jgi:hypothetical protein
LDIKKETTGSVYIKDLLYNGKWEVKAKPYKYNIKLKGVADREKVPGFIDNISVDNKSALS